MRFGNWEVRPVGGGMGCLFMILLSIGVSALLTIIANLIF